MDYPELARVEVETLTKSKTQQYNNLILAKTNSKSLERLACTKIIYEVLAQTTKNQLPTTISKLNWNKIIKKSYCVRSNKREQEPKLGSLIWQHLANPKVNLEKPTTVLFFFFYKNKILILKQLKKLKQYYNKRKAHKRQALMPISMHPKLARAMVNLLYPAKTITDPFCGTGGILIEAGLLKLQPTGIDIDKRMINATKTNLKKYKIKAKLKQADALTVKAKNIATELPFGRNTKKQDLINLYTKFLKNCKKNKSNLVITFPNTINFKKIIKQAKYKIKHEFKIYLHRSLSKTIVVLK